MPRYIDEIPEGLATADQLKAQGLKPGTTTPVALLQYNGQGRSGVCGLFERAAARPAGDPPGSRNEAS
ncbi:hypothetical protein DAETH_43040 (plasmid) [Deinococcus aetherius]|uniref:Uncharacterized protein n=1 Tax=Deinococcus aetherius TaxID=200252 RepID=A0ABN6RLY8_9DEIO|nr:hypothetical protein [Deinococcus aetherius]BDP44335.1 hypothetical protein DAETH_43040 [Deinococcus aetherius]